MIGCIIQRLCLIPINVFIAVIAEARFGRSDNMMDLLRVCCFLLAFILEVKAWLVKPPGGFALKKYSQIDISDILIY